MSHTTCHESRNKRLRPSSSPRPRARLSRVSDRLRPGAKLAGDWPGALSRCLPIPKASVDIAPNRRKKKLRTAPVRLASPKAPHRRLSKSRLVRSADERSSSGGQSTSRFPYARNSHNIPQTAIDQPGAKKHSHRNLDKCRLWSLSVAIPKPEFRANVATARQAPRTLCVASCRGPAVNRRPNVSLPGRSFVF